MTDGNAKPVESSSNNPGSFAAAKSSRLEMPMRHLPQAVRLLALAAAVGGALAPLWARGAGDPTPYSNAPMVLVLNPGRGAVVGSPFRLQVHAASPAAGGAIASVAYTTNGAAPVCSGTAILPVNARYDGGAGGAVYEENVTLGAGSYTLRVCARNAAGTVEAPPVAVTVTAASGDGNLLVRDNANQLCTDCHALQSHTSQSTSNKYGSWAIACRDCHVPHGTRNIYLLGERITPPDVHGANAGGARDVRFSTTVGDSGVAGLTTPTQGSFANADNTGPCQVCHTQTGGATARFRQSGNADAHFTGAATQNCATCHLHTKGFSGSCTTCHGDSSRVGEQTSPPIDTCGNTTGGRVGAHQSHLNGRVLSNGVNCADCHINPPVGGHPTWASCDTDPLHHAVMNWGALARTVLPGDGGTVNPTWDPATQTCSNYCHGDFKNGNRNNTVTWNGTAACGSCHGQGGTTPLPPAPHPQNSACGSCHSTGYTTTTVVAALHIDGRVDSANFSCHSCHGSAANNAPPIAATTGNANAVGAHQAHVAAGSATVTSGYACTVCHVDNGTTNMTHSNGTVDMAWTAPANQGTTPSWSATGSTCANYCHGTSTAQASWGGTGTTPNWLTVNGTYRACNACHGAPPPLNVATHHPFNTACGTCHGAGYAAASVTGAAALGTHVNGAVDTSRTGCTRCHGDLTATAVLSGDGRVAPGFNANAADTTGAPVATSAGVGAHRAHLVNTTFRNTPIACSECHSVPADGDVNHATGGGTGGARATLSWGGLANNGSTFDVRVLAYGTSTTNANGNTAGSCSNTYCHAPRLADTAAGLNLNPSWTGAGTVACGSCHGLPPVTSQHPVGATNCGGCHPGYTASSVNLATHIDGSLQYTPSGCSACHGSSTRTPVASATALDSTGQNLVRASPPADSQGAQASARVGAHAQHVNQEAAAPALSNALACTNCHATPNPATYTLSPLSHVNNTPAVPVFGGIATTGGVNPGYAGGSCSSTYCHGNFPLGNGANPISWGTGTQSKLGCTACHGAPPPIATHHPQSTACGDCHGAGYSASTVNAATHVDGLLTLNADRTGCVACHGTPGRAGVTGADAAVAAAPPLGTRSETLTSTRAVGAHEAHVNRAAAAGAINEPTACAACHGTIPTGTDTTHANGAVAMAAGAGWNTTNLNCSNSCHGSTMPLGGGSNRTPSWSGGPSQAACGTCHGNPPPVIGNGHPQNPTCSTCHPAGYLQGSVAAAAFTPHVNGTLDFNTSGRAACTSCHGDPARALNPALATVTPVDTLANIQAAPPIDTHGNSTQANNGVGAHTRHVNDRSKPLLCAECHGTVPAAGNTSHADTVTTITFLVSELASGLNPATNPGAIVPPAPLNPVYAEDVNGIGTCSSVYCHGDGLPVAARGNNTAPAWNTTLDCNACHGEPPGDAFHRTAGNRTTCVTCHSQTTDATGLILTANGTHVNGFANLTINGVNGCAACHGTANRAVVGTLAQEIVVGAPPRALNGSTARTTAGVGAHEYHVNGSRSNSMTCSECHGDSVIYGQNGMFSHADGTVQMAWGAIATARGAAPGAFTPGTSTTCSSTYCHGNFPGGNGAGPTTAWTTNTASPQLGCTSCHGNPPTLTAASHHPRNSACATCHGTGYSTTTVVQATHVNGLFTLSRSGCTLCHGDLTATGLAASDVRVAPGVNANAADVSGQTAATDPSVGAHAAHLTGTRWRAAIACSECHAPVTDTEVTGWLHATGAGTNGARATLAWGTLATGAVSNWSGAPVAPTYTGSNTATTDTATGSCGTTYCHGAFRNGNARAVTWAGAAAAQTASAACGTCHGTSATNPVPTTGHPTVANGVNCSGCHTGYDFLQGTGPVTGTGVDPATHMNGRQEGGGHAAGWFEPAQHGLAALAAAGGPSSCTTCHTSYGAPSSGTAEDSCNNCHATPMAYGKSYAAGTYPNHTNWQTECTFCHGGRDSTTTGAPPRTRSVISSDTTTPQPVTLAAIGAHTSHTGLGASPATTRNGVANRLACAACHGTTPADLAHVNGASPVSFANVGATANPGTYVAGTGCASNYCHGNFTGGAGTANIAWNAATQTLGCGSCHGQGGAVGQPAHPHPQNTTCGNCHTSYTSNSVNTALHVNGTREWTTTGCTQCHGDRAVTNATNASPLNAAPGASGAATSADTTGQTAATSAGVGAHRAHLTGTRWRASLSCGDCHTVPPDSDTAHGADAGTPGARALLTWGLLASGSVDTAWSPAVTPAYTGSSTASGGTAGGSCGTTYCHGAFKNGNSTNAPAWTGLPAAAACGTCHGASATNPVPTTGHAAVANGVNCSGCHPGYDFLQGTGPVTGGGINAATHINGHLEGGISSGQQACGGCHGALVAAMNNTTSGQMHHYVNNANAPASATAYSTTQPGATTDTTRTCAMCHVDHDLFNANKGANLRSGLLAAPTATASDFSAGAGICTACHTTAQTKAYANGSGTTQTPVIGAAAFTASAHNYGVQSSFGTSNFTGNCVKCHSDTMTQDKQTSAIKFGLHDSTKSSMTDPLGSTVTAMKLEENFCFRCHSATSDTGTPGGGPLKTVPDRDYFGTAGATMTAGSQNLFATMQKGSPGTSGTTQATTTLYLRPAGANLVDGPAPTGYILTSGTYAGTTTFSQYDLALTAGTATTTRTNTSGGTTNRYLRFGQFVSPPVAAAATIASGSTIQISTRAQVSAAGDTENERFQIWRRTAAGVNTSFNTATQQNATALTTTATNRTYNFVTNTAITLSPGDSLILEIESLHGSATTSTVTESFGNFATDGARVVLPVSVTFQNQPAAAASGRHDVGNAGYTGLHRPSPVDETRAYIAANKHVTCTDCHDPHEAMKRATNSFGTASAAGANNSLTDGTKAWTAGQWVGARLTIRSGARAWLGGTVTANTATGLTFTPAMASATAAGDQYILEWPNASGTVSAAGTGTTVTTGRTWVANQWTGYTLYVMSASTGVVSSRAIAANTAAGVLTVSSAVTTAVNDIYWIGLIANANAGVSGVDVTTYNANWTAPTAFNPSATTAALPAALAEWQICFKCHSSANGSLATWDSTFTDLALEFSPRNASYHPVVAALPATDPGANGSNRLQASQLINGWQPGQTMTCTDCHGADTAGPAAQGPHGSAVKFMLTGVNRAWPYTTAGATSGTLFQLTAASIASGLGTQNGLFCRNCHPAQYTSGTTGSNGVHGQYAPQGNHSGQLECVKCHIRVPHGGKVSRLMITANAPVRYQTTGAAPILDAFSKAANGTLWGTGGYSSSNFNDVAGCGQHTSTTPTEAW